MTPSILANPAPELVVDDCQTYVKVPFEPLGELLLVIVVGSNEPQLDSAPEIVPASLTSEHVKTHWAYNVTSLLVL